MILANFKEAQLTVTVIAAFVFACASGLMAQTVGAKCDLVDMKVTRPPQEIVKQFNLSPFYEKFVSANGIPILGSGKVSDYALLEAACIVNNMLAGRDDLRNALIRNKIRVVVMAPTELTTDIPEHSDLKPKDYWDRRARGLGATEIRPATSCGEENLLCYPGDPYFGESILIHEFSHTVHEIALAEVDPSFDGRLRKAYEQAMKGGLWQGTYAATNHHEYWAEGVQIWFHANRTLMHEHNFVGTREQLRRYDPHLVSLLEEVFQNNNREHLSSHGRKGWRNDMREFKRNNRNDKDKLNCRKTKRSWSQRNREFGCSRTVALLRQCSSVRRTVSSY